MGKFLKRTFVKGKMNKDIDERLLPKGEYRHAENIRVAHSSGSDIGAIENELGNIQITNIPSAKTIGAIADQTDETIYWFNVNEQGHSFVYEKNIINNTTSTVLADTRTEQVLGFDKDYLITRL